MLAALQGLPLEVTTGTDTTSVVAVLRGGARTDAGEPRTVLLRGDMDALPVVEETGEDFAATNGAMHACGHDLHTTALVGAAKLLAQHRDQLAGDVVFMFQPGEEGFDGAAVMLDEGVLDAAGTPRRPRLRHARVLEPDADGHLHQQARDDPRRRRTGCASPCAARAATARRRTTRATRSPPRPR